MDLRAGRPLNLLPRPGKQWAQKVSRNRKGDPSSPRRRRRRATYKRTKGVRHLLAGLDMNRDRLCGHNSAIRRYIAWRNRNKHHPDHLHAISMRTKVT